MSAVRVSDCSLPMRPETLKRPTIYIIMYLCMYTAKYVCIRMNVCMHTTKYVYVCMYACNKDLQLIFLCFFVCLFVMMDLSVGGECREATVSQVKQLYISAYLYVYATCCTCFCPVPFCAVLLCRFSLWLALHSSLDLRGRTTSSSSLRS